MSKDKGGRPRKPDATARRVPKAIKVSRPVADYLAEHGTGIIEDMIRRSRAFREWTKQK